MALGVSAIPITQAALAQDATAQDATAQDPAELNTIVVTAQKRAENLQEVPIAITAIDSEKIDKLGVQDARDLSGLAPNVTVTQGTTSNSAAVISMRGISNGGSETFGVDTASGLYVDGIYIARSGAAGLDVADIERIEVLRGPQGTLFGRNTTGGAIHFISREPSKEFRLKAEAGYGNFDAWNGKVTVDPGEIAGIATSFTYSHRQRNGTVDNIEEPRDSRDPGSRRSDAFRGAAKMELGGTGSIRYIFDWSKVRGSPSAFQLTNVADGTIHSLAVDGQPLVVTQQAPVQQYLQAANFASPECAALAVPRREYRSKLCNDISSYAVDQIWGHNLQIENDFGAVKVKATTGYRTWHSSSVADLDGIGAFSGPGFSSATLFNGLPASVLRTLPVIPPAAVAAIAAAPVPTTQQNLFETSNVRRHRQLSQEVELSGQNDHLDWVVGGFYFWEKGSENNPQNSGFVIDTNPILANFGSAAVAANPARYRMVQTLTTLNYTAAAESTAVYGQATYYPGGRASGLRLTVGGRYTWDDKELIRFQNGAAPFAVPQTGNAKFSKFTWNLMLGYDIADGISAYARAATGYRSGGFNASDPASTGTNTIPSFDEENVTSYEIGLKTELFQRRVRLNVAGYYNVYKDLAVNVPVPDAPQGTFSTRIDNAGKVNYAGFEAELQAILTDNFSIDGAVGYVNVDYKKFLGGKSTVPGAPAVDIASLAVPSYTSPWTGNIALNAQFPLQRGNTRLVGRVGYTHEDGKYSFPTAISAPFNEAIKGDSRDLIDAQIGVDRIALGGAEGEIRIWGKNLTNSKDLVRAIDFGQLGFAGGYYADPRTYGITIAVKY